MFENLQFKKTNDSFNFIKLKKIKLNLYINKNLNLILFFLLIFLKVSN